MGLRVARNVDLVLLAAALALFLATDLPLAGWAGGSGIYLVQRLIASFTEAKARATDDPKLVAGWMTGSLVGRGWLVALTIFGTGIAFGDDAGLTAGVLFLATFSIHFLVRMVVRPLEGAR